MLDTTDEIHIGGGNIYQCSTFNCDSFKNQKCCYYPHWHIRPTLIPLTLSIFGDSPVNISLSMEWTTDRKYHYPTNLGMTLDRNPSEPTLWVSNSNYTVVVTYIRNCLCWVKSNIICVASYRTHG